MSLGLREGQTVVTVAGLRGRCKGDVPPDTQTTRTRGGVAPSPRPGPRQETG